MVGARSYRKSEQVHRLGVEGIGARRSSPWRCYAPIGQGKNSCQETPVTGDFSNFAITTKHLTIVPAHPGLKLELRTMSVNPQTRIGARFHRAQRPADPCLGSSVDQTNPNSNQPEPNEATCTFCETNPTHLYRRRSLPAAPLAGRLCETNPIACATAHRTKRDPGDQPPSMIQTGITKRSQSHPSGGGSTRVIRVFRFDETNPISPETTQDKWAEEHLGRGRPLR